MNIPQVKLYFPPEDIEQIKASVEEILLSGMLTLNTYNRRFEDKFASMSKAKYAVAVNSGTGALEVALHILGVKGSEVLVPTNTFSATASSVIHAGGKPVLTDVDPEFLCIDAENIQRYLSPKTKGVIVVHIGGVVCPEIKAIREICEDNNLFLLEDAAHAHGSTLDGQWAGTFGDAGCFSFYPTKVITSCEGGMIVTDNAELDRKARVLRDQGKKSFHESCVVEVGGNWRMSEIHASVGLTQLNRLNEIVKKRNLIADYYNRRLNQISGIRPQKKLGNSVSNYYKYIAFLDAERSSFKQKLRELGVNCSGEVYSPPLHLQPIFSRLFHTKLGDFPDAEDSCGRMVCLPLYSQMTLAEAEYVITCVRYVLADLKEIVCHI